MKHQHVSGMIDKGKIEKTGSSTELMLALKLGHLGGTSYFFPR